MSDHAFLLRTDRKSASGGVNLNMRLGKRRSLVKRNKSVRINLNAAERRFDLLFGVRWRRAARLKFRDLQSAQVGGLLRRSKRPVSNEILARGGA